MMTRQIDPRIKLLSMLVISFIAMTGSTTGIQVYPRLFIILVPAFCLIYLSYYRAGLICLIVLIMGWYGETFQLNNYHTYIYSLFFIISNMITRFFPAVIMGYILIQTTTIELFINALEKMKFPNILTLSLAVMFRFLPVIHQESENIKNAMRMRGMTFIQGCIHPLRYTEMRIVPLINSVVKVSNELTAASLTRGLGMFPTRTSLIRLKLTHLDKGVAFSLFIVALLYYLI